MVNNLDETTTTDVWVMLGLPGGGTYGPVKQLNDVELDANELKISPGVTQDIDDQAPSGVYNYIAYCGLYPAIK